MPKFVKLFTTIAEKNGVKLDYKTPEHRMINVDQIVMFEESERAWNTKEKGGTGADGIGFAKGIAAKDGTRFRLADGTELILDEPVGSFQFSIKNQII